MVEKYDFIFTGLQLWDLEIGSNARDMALEISKNNRVLYINTPQQPRKDKSLRRINENLWVVDSPFSLLSVNKLPDGVVFDFVNKLNNIKEFNFIKEVIEELKFKDVIHIIDNDIYRSFYGKELLKSKLTIYYRRDNLLDMAYWKRHACRLEPLLIAKSDVAVCNSSYLADVARQYNNNTFDIGQGVDLSLYDPSSPSMLNDMANIPRPIVGYLGHITSLRLDPDLLFELASSRENVSFVFVGDADDVFNNHKLKTLPNVYFLGFRSQDKVPQYINSFDICINPQVVNHATIGNYPRKIDEYLSLGKPVLATNTSAMYMFKDYVYLCDGLSDYQKALDNILNGEDGKNIDLRIAFARTHTWEHSVGRLYKAIETKL
ncbi:MAG: glycosyltransferase [Rikenellaceae bacterium]